MKKILFLTLVLITTTCTIINSSEPESKKQKTDQSEPIQEMFNSAKKRAKDMIMGELIYWPHMQLLAKPKKDKLDLLEKEFNESATISEKLKIIEKIKKLEKEVHDLMFA